MNEMLMALRTYQQQRGMSDTDFAHYLNVSYPYLQLVYRGHKSWKNLVARLLERDERLSSIVARAMQSIRGE